MNTNVFDGPQQDIPAVLMNRDRRVAKQSQLLRENPNQVLVAAKLNILGPFKTSPLIRRFFEAGLHRLEDQWLVTG